MITPSTIVNHLRVNLPIYTSEFSSSLAVISASIDASNILTVNSTAHGKSAGDNVALTGGTVRNPLTASVSVDNDQSVQFTTVYDHDQTRPQLPADQQTLTLGGFDNSWDGDHQIIDVPNRRNFIIDGNPAPSVNASQYLKENLIVGSYAIATVPTVNSFTIDFSASPALPVGPIDDLTIMDGLRIWAAADFKRAQAMYTKQTKPCLFVIMTDGDVVKDSHTTNDAVAGHTPQDMHMLRILRNFSTTVFIPTSSDVSGSAAQDLAYGSIYSALVATLFGYYGESNVIQYSAVPVGDGPAEYNTAYYAHVYDWQLPTTLTFEDGYLPTGDVAFRDIQQTLKLFNEEMSVNINLDEVE